MARVEFKMPDEYIARLSKLGNKTDEICCKVVKAGGDAMLKPVKDALTAVVGKDTKVKSRSTGELVESLGVTDPLVDRNGNYNVKVGFNEPRLDQSGSMTTNTKKKKRKGMKRRSYYSRTNAMIANVLEYGRSNQPGKPFLKPAKARGKNHCQEVMKRTFEEELKKI